MAAKSSWVLCCPAFLLVEIFCVFVLCDTFLLVKISCLIALCDLVKADQN